MFVKLTEQEEKSQMKVWEKQEVDIAKLIDFIAKNKANKITAKSAKSKEKVLEKIQSEAIERPCARPKTFYFSFADCAKLPPPVMPFADVSFSYSGKKADYLYSNLVKKTPHAPIHAPIRDAISCISSVLLSGSH